MSKFFWFLPTAGPEVSALGELLECDAEFLETTEPVLSLGEGCFELDGAVNRRHRVKDVMGDVLPNHENALVVSERFAKFLEENQVPDLQVLDVRIWQGRTPVDGYKLVHFTKHISGIDEEESTLVYHEMDPSFVWQVDNLTFKQKKLQGTKIFKVRGLPQHIFVSEEFSQALEAQSFSGFALHDLSEVN
jgi:hypothetical protein